MFAMITFISFLFVSAQILVISFLLLTLGVFVLLFIVALGVRLDCLFAVFLVSCSSLVLLQTSLLALLL